jgi:hypothetical protein
VPPAAAPVTPASKPWYRHFETIGSISAIVVGVAALFVSWDQGAVMRREIAASLWPALQVDGFATRSGEELLIGVRIHNAGVGPALVHHLTLREGGELLPSLAAIAARLPDGAEQRSVQRLAGRILAAGDSAEPFVFAVPADRTVDAVAVMKDLGSWEVAVCYCSSLGDCWTANADGAMPAPVAGCGDDPGVL